MDLSKKVCDRPGTLIFPIYSDNTYHGEKLLLKKKVKISEANNFFPHSAKLESAHLSHLSEQYAEPAQKPSLSLDETFTSKTVCVLPLKSKDKLHRH